MVSESIGILEYETSPVNFLSTNTFEICSLNMLQAYQATDLQLPNTTIKCLCITEIISIWETSE